MDVDKYIDSGILELYVAGALSAAENTEVREAMDAYPAVRAEVKAIEEAVIALASAQSETGAPPVQSVLQRMGDPGETPVRKLKRVPGWWAYSGWAAALIIGVSTLYFYTQNQDLQQSIRVLETETSRMESQILTIREGLAEANQTLRALGERGIRVVPLAGQEVFPEGYARAYWNEASEKVYIDASGLPEPPDGMVYQVWSLKLDPLQPTSIGLLEAYADDSDKIFALANPNASEAFGITLEPEGGSPSPTLEQLYALGAVPS